MKILERYLIKHYLITTVFCTLTLIFLVLIADVFDNLDQFIKNEVTLQQGLRYYLNLIPYVYTQVIQWSSFLGILYLLVTFNFNNELTAMKVAGLQITSIIRPLVFVGIFIGFTTFLINDRLVPPTYKIAKQIQDERIEKKKQKKERTIANNITYYGSGNRLYYIKALSIEKNRAKDFIILWMDEKQRAYRKAMAKEARYNGDSWELRNVTEYEIEQVGHLANQPESFEAKIYPDITETPAEFFKSASDTKFIPYKDLKQYLARLKENGLKPYPEMVDLHEKLAAPWNSLVVMFMCIPLLAKTATRKSMASNVLVCIVAIFLFHVSSAVFLALGKSGKIIPFLSAWIGIAAFGFGSIFFLDRADY